MATTHRKNNTRDMAAAILDESPAPSIAVKHMQRHSCPNCGADLDMREAEAAQERLRELEGTVALLTEKATAAGTLTQSDLCCDCALAPRTRTNPESSGQMRGLRRPTAQHEIAERPLKNKYARLAATRPDIQRRSTPLNSELGICCATIPLLLFTTRLAEPAYTADFIFPFAGSCRRFRALGTAGEGARTARKSRGEGAQTG